MFETRVTPIEASGRPRGKALRAFGWHELTARINAARDLREVLRQDSCLLTASFGDAAAGYFSKGEEGKRPVNPDALEGRKSCHGTEIFAESDANEGDREI